MLLCGCPDNKLPKVPPKVPQPKALQGTVAAFAYGVASQNRSWKAPIFSVKVTMPLRLAFLAFVLGISACAFKQPVAENDSERILYIGGSGYVISQLTTSTWTARTKSQQPLTGGHAASQSDLIDAIEQVSGCKVTASNYSGQDSQLDAQLDCSHQANK